MNLLNFNIGTWLYTLRKGEQVGTDEFGNRYYRGRGAKLQGRERRWVIYKDEVEASRVPPEWHAWLHHTVDEPLTEKAAQAHAWQKVHEPNKTGTVEAYRPKGHDFAGRNRAAATGDYEAWSPEA
ncbi:MAG: NADH:ubiquinone oxidoreductase subunit NDUFA12 [Magnetovibrionaceae bacterium]